LSGSAKFWVLSFELNAIGMVDHSKLKTLNSKL